ncbi:ABC transporter substrate-binding protein [Agrobacterium sp. T29]|uniref:ABC transporter substrate-binding protein n=1 Tax=Agrobacterium sp. T29 TaxID=2580515 RepID=UPI00143DA2E5|nr:ABC transporter substrate-binding protein [Agrobacterium sp. T29]
MSKLRLLLSGVALAMSLGLHIQAASADNTRPLVIARFIDLNSLDPSRSSCETCNVYNGAVYETLVWLGDDDKSFVPGIASEFSANENNTVFTFVIDPRATFSDGSKVEAKDVKWTLDRLKNAKGGNSFIAEDIVGIETPDEKTVVVTLAKPNSEFLGKMTSVYAGIINSDVAAAEGGARAGEDASNDPAEGWFLAHSAGSGPYVLVEYRPEDVLRLKRNVNYWGKPAAIDEIVIRHVKDAVSQAQAVERGDADLSTQIDPSTASLITNPDIVVESAPTYSFVYFALGPGAEKTKVPMPIGVRQAIGYAIDYQGVLEFTVGGKGRLQPVAIPNGFPGTDNLPMPEYNLEKAKELMKQSGAEAGFNLEAIYPNTNAFGVEFSLLGQKLQQDLAKINVTLNLQPLPVPQWIEEMNTHGIPFTMGFYAPDYLGSDQYINTFGMFEGTRWFRRSGIGKTSEVLVSKEKDLLDKALSSSQKERDQLYNEIAQQMIGDKIIFPLVNPDVMLVHRKNVVGLRNAMCCQVKVSDLKYMD